MAENLSMYEALQGGSEFRGFDSRLAEDFVAVLDDELHNKVLGVHVGHLPLDVQISHDSWGEDYRQILWGHLRRVSWSRRELVKHS